MNKVVRRYSSYFIWLLSLIFATYTLFIKKFGYQADFNATFFLFLIVLGIIICPILSILVDRAEDKKDRNKRFNLSFEMGLPFFLLYFLLA